MRNFYITLVLCFFALNSWSQEYLRMIEVGTYTVQEIQAEAEAYFATVGTERGKGYNPYKRWEYNALRNMDENGMLKTPEFYYNELQNYNNYLNQNGFNSRSTAADTGNWEQLGPTSWNATSGWNPGVGRITSIAVDKTNINHIIVGANTGGVWKTTNGGTTWTVLTDNLSNLNVYALAIDPTNSSTYFWGSTNGSIFRSTDAGSTWSLISITGGGTVNKILIDPNNTTKMYCSVQGGGIYKSTTSGTTWSLIDSGATNGYDVEFKPGDTNTIYASGSQVYKSTDGGATFTTISGFNSGPKMIGVSDNDPSVVYVLEANSGAFGGFYRSSDSGSTFLMLNHSGKNYFGYSSNPEDPGDVGRGQAPRDMDIAVNPANVNDVHIAGINSWRSTDGGISFSITSQWTPGGAASGNIGYCHADIDIMEYIGSKLYIGSDGGIYVANNPTVVNNSYYTDLTAGLGIRQFYKIGISQSSPVIVSGGAQDNGTSVYTTAGTWRDWLGADGMESFVDKNNNNILYGTSQNGSLYKSTNGGNSYFGLSEPDGKSGNWITPFEQDPNTQDVIYSGYDQVYKSTNGGASWTAISQNFGSNLDHLKIAPSSSFTMYAARGSNLYRTFLGGAGGNWSQVTGFIGTINSIAVHPTDDNKIAIATSGTQKVYVSTNAGTSWTSYRFDLPNFSALALAWSPNGNDGLYLGMNYGVYYIDNTTGNSWKPFSNNLPNVQISELEINTVENKIYAATYGRGLWRSPLFDPNLSVGEFELDNISLYPNPAAKEVNISWSKNEDVSIRIFNSLGKLMYYSKSATLNSTFKIDVSQYASGLYFVKINNEAGVVTKKLIVE
ncbi:T9SS type A sorting domain-containing protein [Aquaticitalea lipolytica]|uniref:T9SS type A sorting domain-containing protein n=1 Tax=Aquaticitalea lipolytica TaxID=1247562 RepID=UPI0024B9E9B3|nr:T9SS type A sorting domain-containing protein [Aquaticitalea lipolytica]